MTGTARSPVRLRTARFVLLVGVRLLAAASVLACSGGPGAVSTRTTNPAVVQPKVYVPASPAPDLNLLDQAGQPFTLSQLRGRSALVSFGYSHCPDVCPTTLAIDRDVAAALPDSVAVVFVTIDPERDTPEALRTFLGYFNARFIGLTGPPAAIRTAADAWGVSYARGSTDRSGGYAMVHSAGTYVVDPEGDLRFLYPYGTPDDVLAAAVRAFAHP